MLRMHWRSQSGCPDDLESAIPVNVFLPCFIVENSGIRKGEQYLFNIVFYRASGDGQSAWPRRCANIIGRILINRD